MRTILKPWFNHIKQHSIKTITIDHQRKKNHPKKSENLKSTNRFTFSFTPLLLFCSQIMPFLAHATKMYLRTNNNYANIKVEFFNSFYACFIVVVVVISLVLATKKKGRTIKIHTLLHTLEYEVQFDSYLQVKKNYYGLNWCVNTNTKLQSKRIRFSFFFQIFASSFLFLFMLWPPVLQSTY